MVFRRPGRYEVDRRGVTLTEMAIALGVAGIVVLGAWIAGGQARQNSLIEQSVSLVWQISENIRTVYAGHSTAAATASSNQQVFVCGGIFPESTLASTSVTYSCSGVNKRGPIDPWGGAIVVVTTGTAYEIRLYLTGSATANISKCAGFLSKFNIGAEEGNPDGISFMGGDGAFHAVETLRQEQVIDNMRLFSGCNAVRLSYNF